MMARRADEAGHLANGPSGSISGIGQPVDADGVAGGVAPKLNEFLKIECPRGYYAFIR